MARVRAAEASDIDELIRLEGELFATDAAAHEPLTDPTWPAREGWKDFEELLPNGRCLVLVADADGITIGHLVGYLAASSPTRLPSTYAVLRSVYVDTERQLQGVGTALVDAFIACASSQSARTLAL